MSAKRSVTFWGWVLTSDDDGRARVFKRRSITTDGITIEEMGTVKPDEYDFTGVVVPTLENAHAHLADRRLKVKEGTPLADVVRPPDGLKHQYLKAAPEEEVVGSIRAGLEDLIQTGAVVTHEFREGGIEGVRAYQRALDGLPATKRMHFRPIVLGRPGSSLERPKDEKGFWAKMSRLLDVCDGLGLSAISDGDPAWNREVARFARRLGKRVEVHCSETEHEPIDGVLDAGAQQVVHMVHGTAADFKRLAQARVPVAVCTRSNTFFGLTAPVPLMVEAGVDIRIGTDNAFLGPPDMFAEARAFTHAHKAKARLTPMQILSFLFARKTLNGGLAIAPAEGNQPDFLIVNIQTEKPERDLLAKASASDVAAVVGRQSE